MSKKAKDKDGNWFGQTKRSILIGNYTRRLKTCGFQINMSRKGNPYGNATEESFLQDHESGRSLLLGISDLNKD